MINDYENINKFLRINDYKNINLDIICCRKHTWHETFWTMAVLLSSDKNNPKTRMNLF